MPITSPGMSMLSPGRFPSTAASPGVAGNDIAASSASKGARSPQPGASPSPPPRSAPITVAVQPPTISSSTRTSPPATS